MEWASEPALTFLRTRSPASTDRDGGPRRPSSPGRGSAIARPGLCDRKRPRVSARGPPRRLTASRCALCAQRPPLDRTAVRF
jgi:hypothetical protein